MLQILAAPLWRDLGSAFLYFRVWDFDLLGDSIVTLTVRSPVEDVRVHTYVVDARVPTVVVAYLHPLGDSIVTLVV